MKGEKSSGGEIEVLMVDSEANRRETNFVRVIERSTQEILDSRNRDSTISIYMFDFFHYQNLFIIPGSLFLWRYADIVLNVKHCFR